jgi:hypothetical protein
MKLDPSIFSLKYYQRLEDMPEDFINTVQILFYQQQKLFLLQRKIYFLVSIAKSAKGVSELKIY